MQGSVELGEGRVDPFRVSQPRATQYVTLSPRVRCGQPGLLVGGVEPSDLGQRGLGDYQSRVLGIVASAAALA